MVEIEGVSGKFDRLNIPRIPSQNVTECRSHGTGVENIPITADLLICFETAAGIRPFLTSLEQRYIYETNIL